MGEEFLQDKMMEKKEKAEKRGEVINNVEEEEDYGSRFIISPNNYWNMQWNNLTQVIFVIYIIITPVIIA